MESWIKSASTETDFPLSNLPYGVFRPSGGPARCGVAIGDQVLDLAALEEDGLLETGNSGPVFAASELNGFMALGPSAWRRVRDCLTDLLTDGASASTALRDDVARQRRCLYPADSVAMLLPARIRGYTDFNAARQHAYNAGVMLRGQEDALPPNWLHMPIAYNGRASTVVVSGTPILRPWGQFLPAGSDRPIFGPSRRLDFELELGAFIGTPTRLGERVGVAEAEEMIFGYVLLNDWSARDIQRWESQPLGPFQGKAFGTTISPWVVSRAALEPVRTGPPEREYPLLPYLREPGPMHHNIALEAKIDTLEDREGTVVTRTNARHLYYSMPQMMAHHSASGCTMETGDLIGTGTVSGPEPTAWASLFELSRGGSEAIRVGAGTRTFLEDGDGVSISGYGMVGDERLGFGRCDGTIVAAAPA